jgi:hypothetical protein
MIIPSLLLAFRQIKNSAYSHRVHGNIGFFSLVYIAGTVVSIDYRGTRWRLTLGEHLFPVVNRKSGVKTQDSRVGFGVRRKVI